MLLMKHTHRMELSSQSELVLISCFSTASLSGVQNRKLPYISPVWRYSARCQLECHWETLACSKGMVKALRQVPVLLNAESAIWLNIAECRRAGNEEKKWVNRPPWPWLGVALWFSIVNLNDRTFRLAWLISVWQWEHNLKSGLITEAFFLLTVLAWTAVTKLAPAVRQASEFEDEISIQPQILINHHELLVGVELKSSSVHLKFFKLELRLTSF